MDIELATQWVNALESGNYAQTTGVMRREHTDGNIGYCCLGVLKEITGVRWAKAHHFEQGGKFSFIGWQEDGSVAFFPEEYDDASQSMLPDSAFQCPSDEDFEEWGLSMMEACRLTEMNDDGESFDGIADYIRTRLMRHERTEAA